MIHESSPQIIQKPNLRRLQVVLIIFIVLRVLVILPTADLIGLNQFGSSIDSLFTYIFSFRAIVLLFYISTLILIAKYILNFELKYSRYMLYIAVLCVLIDSISNTYSFHIVRGSLGNITDTMGLSGEDIYGIFSYTAQQVAILSTICRLSILLSIIMFTITGFNLLLTEKDYVGGLNILGIAFIVYALSSSFVFVITYYISDVSTTIKTIIIIFEQIAIILIPASMLYISRKAMKHNANINSGK